MAKKKIEISCPDCWGMGKIADRTCSTCGGKGRVIIDVEDKRDAYGKPTTGR